jgi:hypothetical protein
LKPAPVLLSEYQFSSPFLPMGVLGRGYACGSGTASGKKLRQWLNLECGDTSPLADWETCLPVPQRGHVRALQIKALPKLLR